MIKGRGSSDVVYVKGDLYVFSCYDTDGKRVMSVDKYSISSKAWSQVAEMYDDRREFCTCSLMNEIFVIVGINNKVKTNCS